MTNNLIAIIGGSGIKDSPEFVDTDRNTFSTQYSKGFAEGVVPYHLNRQKGVIFIPRHGTRPRYSPSRTQYGANLIAAKMLGASAVIATSAVGSLTPDIPIGSLVIPEDYIDETGRDDNLFGKGIIVHAQSQPAFSSTLRDQLITAVREMNQSDEFIFTGASLNGTYVCIPGDRFGTKAESKKRAQYADIVGMTLCPEAAMAMQLGLHYAVVAFTVDNDFDANHQRTLRVMQELSAPVPTFMSIAIEQAKKIPFDQIPLPQLEHNVIPGDTSLIKNLNLKQVAKELVATYC